MTTPPSTAPDGATADSGVKVEAFSLDSVVAVAERAGRYETALFHLLSIWRNARLYGILIEDREVRQVLLLSGLLGEGEV